MDDKGYSIEEILDSEKLIFVDTSCQSLIGKDILRETFETRHYAELKKRELLDNLESLSIYQFLMGSQNTYTIPGVANEISELCDGLSTKIKYLNSNPKMFAPNKHSRKKLKSCDESKDLLIEIQRKVWNNLKLARGKMVSEKDERVNILTEMVKIIDNELTLKLDTSRLYGNYDPNKEVKSTDEEMVGQLYFSSIFSKEKPCLMTRDTDFIRLFGVTGKILGSDEFLPYNDEFRRGIVYNPIRVFYGESDGWVKVIDSSNFKFDSEFRLNFRTNERNDLVKNKVFDLWKDFSYLGKINEQSDESHYPAVEAKYPEFISFYYVSKSV